MPRTVSDGGEDHGADVASRTSSHRRMEHGHGYKVGIPPKKSLLTEFSDAVKETFFADDPLRQYKDQPKSKKLWLGLQHIFPVLDWSRRYSLSKFKGDFIAGLTIASLCIPQVSRAI
jgi:sulfate transporter 1, high-affinity